MRKLSLKIFGVIFGILVIFCGWQAKHLINQLMPFNVEISNYSGNNSNSASNNSNKKSINIKVDDNGLFSMYDSDIILNENSFAEASQLAQLINAHNSYLLISFMGYSVMVGSLILGLGIIFLSLFIKTKDDTEKEKSTSKKQICKHCNTEIAQNAKFCVKCGNIVTSEKFAPKIPQNYQNY